MAYQKKASTSTELATVEATKVTAVSTELAGVFEEDAAQSSGFERDDLALPFLRLLQKMSPEVDKRDAKYVEGASDGDFINTATNEVWDGAAGVIVAPIVHQRSITEWRPRKDGGGLVKDHGSDVSILDQLVKDPQTGKDVLPNGNELVRASLYYLYIIDPDTGAFQSAALSLSSTQLKKARRWNTLMETLSVKNPATGKHFRPAPFYMAYKLTSVAESNDKGSWSGIKVEYNVPVVSLPNGQDIYMAARGLRDAIQQGAVKTQGLDTAMGGEESTEDLPF